MKVAVLRQPGSLSLTRRNRPVPGRGQALVKVLAAGICGSDLQAFQGSNPLQAYPCIPGHEICGEVAEVAPPTGHIKPGDRVVLDPMQSCGTCYPCRIGRYNCCTALKVFGVHRDGGFAEFVAESTKRLFKVNPRLPPEEAALVEPFTVAAHALGRARVRPQEKVAIFGAGTIGSAALQIAHNQGAQVLITDVYDARLRRAERLGAHTTLNVTHEDLGAAIHAFAGQAGPQAIIVATGSQQALKQALSLIGPAGRIAVVGLVEKETPLRAVDLVRKELDVLGVRNSKDRFPEVIRLLSEGKIHPRPLITHTFGFQDIQAAFQLMIDEPEKVGKVVLLF